MNDQMFALMMIPHHEQAVEMSDLAESRTTNADVLALARQIRDAQAPEIAQMKTWTDDDAGDHMGHMDGTDRMDMDGMLTELQMSDLRRASGIEFDRLFLAGMIEHHKGAIDMAQMILKSKNEEVRTLGENIVRTQQEEIDRMRSLLDNLPKS
jgi:uncharacterized protein (DUF305 family)